LSFETRGLEKLLVTPRSAQVWAKVFDVIGEPRSWCSVTLSRGARGRRPRTAAPPAPATGCGWCQATRGASAEVGPRFGAFAEVDEPVDPPTRALGERFAEVEEGQPRLLRYTTRHAELAHPECDTWEDLGAEVGLISFSLRTRQEQW
jgi:hypothetical protein